MAIYKYVYKKPSKGKAKASQPRTIFWHQIITQIVLIGRAIKPETTHHSGTSIIVPCYAGFKSNTCLQLNSTSARKKTLWTELWDIVIANCSYCRKEETMQENNHLSFAKCVISDNLANTSIDFFQTTGIYFQLAFYKTHMQIRKAVRDTGIK